MRLITRKKCNAGWVTEVKAPLKVRPRRDRRWLTRVRLQNFLIFLKSSYFLVVSKCEKIVAGFFRILLILLRDGNVLQPQFCPFFIYENYIRKPFAAHYNIWKITRRL